MLVSHHVWHPWPLRQSTRYTPSYQPPRPSAANDASPHTTRPCARAAASCGGTRALCGSEHRQLLRSRGKQPHCPGRVFPARGHGDLGPVAAAAAAAAAARRCRAWPLHPRSRPGCPCRARRHGRRSRTRGILVGSGWLQGCASSRQLQLLVRWRACRSGRGPCPMLRRSRRRRRLAGRAAPLHGHERHPRHHRRRPGRRGGVGGLQRPWPLLRRVGKAVRRLRLAGTGAGRLHQHPVGCSWRRGRGTRGLRRFTGAAVSCVRLCPNGRCSPGTCCRRRNAGIQRGAAAAALLRAWVAAACVRRPGWGRGRSRRWPGPGARSRGPLCTSPSLGRGRHRPAAAIAAAPHLGHQQPHDRQHGGLHGSHCGRHGRSGHGRSDGGDAVLCAAAVLPVHGHTTTSSCHTPGLPLSLPLVAARSAVLRCVLPAWLAPTACWLLLRAAMPGRQRRGAHRQGRPSCPADVFGRHLRAVLQDAPHPSQGMAQRRRGHDVCIAGMHWRTDAKKRRAHLIAANAMHLPNAAPCWCALYPSSASQPMQGTTPPARCCPALMLTWTPRNHGCPG